MGIFDVAKSKFDVKITKFKMADQNWRPYFTAQAWGIKGSVLRDFMCDLVVELSWATIVGDAHMWSVSTLPLHWPVVGTCFLWWGRRYTHTFVYSGFPSSPIFVEDIENPLKGFWLYSHSIHSSKNVKTTLHTLSVGAIFDPSSWVLKFWPQIWIRRHRKSLKSILNDFN